MCVVRLVNFTIFFNNAERCICPQTNCLSRCIIASWDRDIFSLNYHERIHERHSSLHESIRSSMSDDQLSLRSQWISRRCSLTFDKIVIFILSNEFQLQTHLGNLYSD